MKKFYKRYLVPVAAALLAITFIIIITIPIHGLSEAGKIECNGFKVMIAAYTSYLIAGVCIGVTLIIMRFMLKSYSRKKRFWCYLIIGFIFMLLPRVLPFLWAHFNIMFVKIFLNIRNILPITGAVLMVMSPIELRKK